MSITLTALYGSILTILFVLLSTNVTRIRASTDQSLGDGEGALLRATRAQGNFAEYVPLAITMMALVELMGGAPLALHIFGGLLIAARLIHAFGLLKTNFPGRVVGSTSTWGILVGLSIYALMIR